MERPPLGPPRAYNPAAPSARALADGFVAYPGASRAAARAQLGAAMGRLGRRDDVSFGFDAENARAVNAGRVVRFRDADERARAVALAREMRVATGVKRAWARLRKGRTEDFWRDVEENVWTPVQGKYREGLVDRALRGVYHGGEEGLGKRLVANGTYRESHSRGFWSVLGRLVGGK
jgi:hypothetical protein